MQRREFIALTLCTLASAASAGPRLLPGPAAATVAKDAIDAADWHRLCRFVRTDFGNVACIDHGEGEAALFLHGFPLNSFQWRGAIARLAPYRRCIAPDFLGLGHSEAGDGQSLAPDAQVGMLLALLDALGIDSVDVVANDSGGQAAQLLVASHPQRVRSLLLSNCDTEINSPPAAMAPVIALARENRWVDEWIAPWHADPVLARSAEGIGAMCYADPGHPTDEAIDAYFSPLLASPRRRRLANAYAVALARNPLTGIGPRLARCGVPTRIVWGMADTIFAPDDADHLDRAFDRSRGIRRLPGYKLFWPEERPDVIAEEALRLWDVRLQGAADALSRPATATRTPVR
ncbi:alpha/beta fold hydrolase [Marilutibacter chinensis]|uniref:Alpha/beta fold hydrolase n=1 Tax=Marilutibacter chinensis TaxID=2912247 RepID=A0ABS9HTM8_9GAMM|nr:alpha/beta fold hydrolase [Lysobacter chinensis]MCF7222250.1 alpha/beta fold hydrolase [Lysobacter chinensis]